MTVGAHDDRPGVRHAAGRSVLQSMDSGQLLVIGVAGLLLVVAVTQVTVVGLSGPTRTAVLFGLLVAVGELARMVMPGNREVAPIASAAGYGYALILEVGNVPERHSALQVVVVAAVGMLVGSAPHVAVGRSPRPDAMARRLLAIAVVAFAYRPPAMAWLPKKDLSLGQWLGALALMAAAVMLGCMTDVLLSAMLRAEAVRTRFGIALGDEADAKLALCAAVGTTGMVIAIATSVMGLPALAVFTAPILITQTAFRRYAGIRATYLQTVRALSRVTEVGGYVETGHSRRVARLAVAMGRELGMAEPELLDLEYAALMHDIGQLSLGDPIPGGATVLASPAEQWRIAQLGAGVIEQTGVLPRVAEVVRRQSDSYRGGYRGGVEDGSGERLPPPPLASRIIKVANAYDDLVGDSSDRDRAAAVLERLRSDSATEYDPAVVEALGRVLDRGVPRHP
jgi:hypothetical protein